MADNIIVSYKDNLDKLTADLKAYRDQQIGLNKNIDDQGNKAKAAGDKTSAALKETGKQAEGTGNLFDKLGAQIIAAFSVGAIIAFGKASVEAFAEAELSARKLNAALSAGGGTNAQFKTLLEQSKELQKITIFSDEQIQSAQTLALQFGLTATEVEKLIPTIADFASATGQGLTSALEAVLRGSEGVARGLKVYGIEVDANGTKTQRLAQITDQLTQKFGGQAQQVGETTTGAFLKLKNAFNDLEETIGGLLAKGDGFLDFLSDGIKRTAEFLNIFKSSGQKEAELFDKVIEAAKKNGVDALNNLRDELTKAGKDSSQAFTTLIDKSNQVILDSQAKLDAGVNEAEKKRLEGRIKIETARRDAIIAIQNDEAKAAKRATEERIEQEADAAKKLKEAQEKAVKDAADAVAKINEDNFKLAEDNLKKFQAEQITLIEGQNISREEKEKQFAQLELDVLLARRQNYLDYGKDVGDIDVQIANKHIEQNQKREKSDKENSDNALKLLKEDVKEAIRVEDERLKAEEDAAEKRKQLQRDVFDLAQDLTNDLQDLFRSQSDEEIDRINSLKDERVAAIDEQIKSLEDANNRGKLSDKGLEIQKKQLLAQRTAAEKQASEQQKKLRREEAEQEKALALFKIGLLLAEAIAEGDVFKAIAAGIQLAVVAAKPIPAFRRGTKGKKETGIGLVGEEGPEFLWMPRESKVVPADKTRRYRDAIDSMIDGTFNEKFVYKTMIASALREANRQAEKHKQKTFAENIAHLFNVKAEVDPYRLADGIKSNNKELAWQIGKAVAKNLNSGYKNPRYH